MQFKGSKNPWHSSTINIHANARMTFCVYDPAKMAEQARAQLRPVPDPFLLQRFDGTACAVCICQRLFTLMGPDNLARGDDHLALAFLHPLLLLSGYIW